MFASLVTFMLNKKGIGDVFLAQRKVATCTLYGTRIPSGPTWWPCRPKALYFEVQSVQTNTRAELHPIKVVQQHEN